MCVFFSPYRSASRAEVHHQGDGSTTPDWFIGVICYHHIRNHRTRVLLRGIAQDLLQVRYRIRDKYTLCNINRGSENCNVVRFPVTSAWRLRPVGKTYPYTFLRLPIFLSIFKVRYSDIPLYKRAVYFVLVFRALPKLWSANYNIA